VNSPQGEMTGDFVSNDMRRELADVSGAPPGQAAPPTSRVKVVIVPRKKPAEREEEKKPPALELKSDPGKS